MTIRFLRWIGRWTLHLTDDFQAALTSRVFLIEGSLILSLFTSPTRILFRQSGPTALISFRRERARIISAPVTTDDLRPPLIACIAWIIRCSLIATDYIGWNPFFD